MTSRSEAASDDTAEAITDALLTASRLLVAISARSIADVDETLTTAQFRTMVILSTRGAMNIVTLADFLEVQPSTATRMVDRLVAAGFVERTPHPQSRRELVVALTGSGRGVVSAVTTKRREEIASIVDRMPVNRRRGLIKALTAFTVAGGEPAATRADSVGFQL